MQTNIFNVWFYLSVLIALLDWFAVSKDNALFRIISKPLVLISILLWFSSVHGWNGWGVYFGLALIFSLLGDIFLLKRLILLQPTFFQLGLVAFLFTQIFYGIGFNQAGLPPLTPGILVLLSVVVISSLNGKRILQSLQKTREGKKLILPIVIYMSALSLMVISATTTLFRPAWQPASALLVSLAASFSFIGQLGSHPFLYFRFYPRP